ncbi:MAG: hypothetical protein FIB08_06505 [Candidatus Methanoperedens sp.]|nr:hypothetical protein [Candidatus Methanoperedens sp.]
MSSVSEDAMFKALLKNKPEPKPQVVQKTEVQVRRENTPKPGSEDAMYKALLNRPQKQVIQKPQVKESAPVAQVIAAPAEPKIEVPVIETRVAQGMKPAETEAIVESIKALNASVNMVHGLLKTVIVPVLVLMLLIGIALLIKAK